MVKGALCAHVGDDSKLELAMTVFVLKIVPEPFPLCLSPHGATDVVAELEQLVDDVGGDEPVCACKVSRGARVGTGQGRYIPEP